MVYQARKLHYVGITFSLHRIPICTLVVLKIEILVWCPQSCLSPFTASISNKFCNRDIKPVLGIQICTNQVFHFSWFIPQFYIRLVYKTHFETWNLLLLSNNRQTIIKELSVRHKIFIVKPEQKDFSIFFSLSPVPQQPTNPDAKVCQDISSLFRRRLLTQPATDQVFESKLLLRFPPIQKI